MRIAAYGAGRDFENFILLMKSYSELMDDDLVCLVDGDRNKWGNSVGDYVICRPDTLKSKELDAVIITSMKYYDEISEGIHRDFPYVKSYSITEYKEKKIIEYQYNRNKKKNSEKDRSILKPFNSNSTVVYTAIFGDYDELREPCIVEPGVKYVCFTDQKGISSSAWDIEYVDAGDADRRLLTREYKIMPHRLFPSVETSIWIDANIHIKGSLCQLYKEYQQCSNILFFPYMDCMCIYDAALLLTKRESKDVLLKQIFQYYKEGYPTENGFMCGGVIVRNHNESDIIRVMEAWYEQVKTFSKRDQISLPYVFWKYDVGYDLINADLYHNDFVEVVQHKPMAYANANKGKT